MGGGAACIDRRQIRGPGWCCSGHRSGASGQQEEEADGQMKSDGGGGWTLCSGDSAALHLTSLPDTARPSDLCGMSFKSSSDPCLFRPDIMKTLNGGGVIGG